MHTRVFPGVGFFPFPTPVVCTSALLAFDTCLKIDADTEHIKFITQSHTHPFNVCIFLLNSISVYTDPNAKGMTQKRPSEILMLVKTKIVWIPS